MIKRKTEMNEEEDEEYNKNVSDYIIYKKNLNGEKIDKPIIKANLSNIKKPKE
jgi:hypothetical protein